MSVTLNDHLFVRELFIRFTVLVFRARLSICVCPSFPFGLEGRMWDLVVLIPDCCLSCSFKSVNNSLIRIQELSGGKVVSISDICRTRWQVADEQFEVRLTEMYFILFDGKSDFVLSVCQGIRILDKIHNKNTLKIVSLIYFMVSEINILTEFRSTVSFTFIIN